jgi:GTP diphosphokinase / guanosine-3',5'-bis(diphosphate) 3'-diphosphatase
MDWTQFEHQIGHLDAKSRMRVKEAFDLGEKVHAGQKRKSGEPYFSHPVEVARILATMGADEETLIVALLHDAVEDTPVTIEELGKLFGPSVQRLIDGLTKLTAQEVASKPTLNEQTETIRKMFTLMRQDIRIMVIKLVDRLHNMQTIRFLPPERQIEMAIETTDIYAKVANKLCMQELCDALEGLCLAVLEPGTHETLAGMRRNALKESPRLIERLRERLREHPVASKADLSYEFQPWAKQRLLLGAGNGSIIGMPRHTLAFVCEDEDACYALLGALHRQWPSEVLSFQDFVNSPVMNGYRGIHTTIILEDGMRVRCKIRTREMQEYARRGIALYCFDNAAQDHLSYLPWMQRIAPLAEDTKDRSQDFWDSLQNDILGQSILVYGAENRSVSLPAGSTALDVAFHLYPDDAVKLESVLINGNSVPFHHRVKHGDTLDVSISDAIRVKREWLEWVNTSFATAQIRSALAGLLSEQEKLESGKQMLQRVMHEGKKGYIEEFNERSLAASLASMGYDSLPDAYIAIADGHLDPLDAYIILFDTRRGDEKSKQQCEIRFFLDPVDAELLEYLRDIEQNRDSFRELRIRYSPAAHGGNVLLRMFLTPQEQNSVLSELKLRGAGALRLRFPKIRWAPMAGVIAILVMWGLDPVLAKYLVGPDVGVHPVDFTIMRYLGFFLVSLLHLIGSSGGRYSTYHKLPKADWLLFVAGLSFMTVGLSTYVSLQAILPQNYTAIVYVSSILIPILSPFEHLVPDRRIRSVSLLLAFGALGLLWALEPSIPGWAFGAALAMLVSFSIFTISINEYRRRHHVAARTPMLLFLISVVSLACCIPLLPFSTLSQAGLPTVGLMLAYGILMVGLPYHLYYNFLFTKWLHTIGLFYPLSFCLTLIGQLVLFDVLHIASLAPFALIAIAAMLLLHRDPRAPASLDV